ncbi:MAG: hypothetical protein IKI58_02465 [Oscillospiraceae bacterium]|nr:hypothetical protein [Oscillospiraceae bacterium]
MKEPRLEWEPEDAKKAREILAANRKMDAGTGETFSRSWEEDPSVQHGRDSSGRPFHLNPNLILSAQENTRQQNPAAKQRRRSTRNNQQHPRRGSTGKPHLKVSVNASPDRHPDAKRRLKAVKRIRLYLLAAAAILILMGIFFALIPGNDPPEPASGSTVSANLNSEE